MKQWRLHLSNQPLRRVHILADQLAVCSSRYHYLFYNLENGDHRSDLVVDPDLLDKDDLEARQNELNALQAPNGEFLPYAEFSSANLYVSKDGQLRLIHDIGAGIGIEKDEEFFPLETDGSVLKVALERNNGKIVAFTEKHQLAIFQNEHQQGVFPLENTAVLRILLLDDQIILILPDAIQIMDSDGKIIRQQKLHYTAGLAALSAQGGLLAISDIDYNVIRIYDHHLNPLRQQHVIDLLEKAPHIHHFVPLPSSAAPVTALDIANDGMLVFALNGMLCTTHIEMMAALPRRAS